MPTKITVSSGSGRRSRQDSRAFDRQLGLSAAAWMAAAYPARRRYAVGGMPTLRLKRELNVPTLLYPTCTLMSATFIDVETNRCLARCRRNADRKRPGETPVERWKIRVK